LKRESRTVAEAARLLGCSRPTVDQKLKAGALSSVPGVSPMRISTHSLLIELQYRVDATISDLERLQLAVRTLSSPEPSDGVQVNDGLSRLLLAENANVHEALERERIGRAAAELRIDELKRDLRRANAAITVLQADPDLGL
jgi:excisionase family DNA binding protein